MGEGFFCPTIRARTWQEAVAQINNRNQLLTRMLSEIYTGANIPSGRLDQGTKIDGIEDGADVTGDHSEDVDALVTQNAPAEADADVTSGHSGDDAKNLAVVWKTVATVDIDVDYIQVEGFNLTSVDLTVNLAASGANGLDTGSEAANTWYSLWVIYNPATTTVASLLSLSTLTPTMPSGYTKKRRVGWVRNDGSSNFLKFYQLGDLWYWDVAYYVLITEDPAESWTDVDCSPCVPPSSGLIITLQRTADYNQPEAILFVRRNGSSEEAYGMQIQIEDAPAVKICVGGILVPCDSDQIIEYKVAANGNLVNIAVAAYYDLI